MGYLTLQSTGSCFLCVLTCVRMFCGIGNYSVSFRLSSEEVVLQCQIIRILMVVWRTG